VNKIKSLFKASPIAVIAVALLVAGVASAAVVNYLSNSTTTATTITSPIEMSVNNDRDISESSIKSININTTGGSDFTFTTVAKNNANNEISGYPVIVVEATDGGKLTGEEFTKVMFKDKNGTHDITELLYVVNTDGSLTKLSSKTWNNEKLVLSFVNYATGNTIAAGGVVAYPLSAGEVNWNILTITLNQAIVGTYTISSQYANDLAEYATHQYGL